MPSVSRLFCCLHLLRWLHFFQLRGCCSLHRFGFRLLRHHCLLSWFGFCCLRGWQLLLSYRLCGFWSWCVVLSWLFLLGRNFLLNLSRSCCRFLSFCLLVRWFVRVYRWLFSLNLCLLRGWVSLFWSSVRLLLSCLLVSRGRFVNLSFGSLVFHIFCFKLLLGWVLQLVCCWFNFCGR